MSSGVWRRCRRKTSCCGTRRRVCLGRTSVCGRGLAKLERELEEARRAAKRQTAPFSRGEPSGRPRRAGRRFGGEHGRHGHREPPGEVDEELDASLADRCACGGEILEERIEYRYQDELPEPRRLRRRFAVHIGKCRCCGRRHQGQHPFQTSDALGAAACMLGPRAMALAAELNKGLLGSRRRRPRRRWPGAGSRSQRAGLCRRSPVRPEGSSRPIRR
jgi:hypothetical protein